MVANAAEFLALASLKRDKVEVGGQVVHVREMSVRERAKLLEMVKTDQAMVPAYLVQCCALTEDGKPLFSEKDAEALASAAPAVVDAVASVVMRLSGMQESPNA